VALRFTGQGQVLGKSARVDAVARAANASDPLIQAGIQLERPDGFAGPRYHLRGFNEVKPQLLEEATRNAREQASKFAADAGATLGALKRANQGVLPVLGDGGRDMDRSRTVGEGRRVVSTVQFALDRQQDARPRTPRPRARRPTSSPPRAA